MTNKYNAFPRKKAVGWNAMVRFCRDGDANPICGPGNIPIEYLTREEALEACLTHVLSFINGKKMRGEQYEGSTRYYSADDAFKGLEPFKRGRS